ncbi:MAG TPA: hypothetical protein VJS92_10215, partial [Candidatus Polarisedimenticolaceae bacterium]|nr:hypothetical protein [Candidatus Polarisedimenticolaceae bacterium]
RLRAVVLGAEAVAARADDRETLERAWGTETHEVAWSVELGAWGFGCSERDRLHVNETEYLAEVVGGDEGLDSGELVLTQLGRVGSPLIRYRTGRRVELSRSPCACGCGAVSVFTPEVTKAKA